jgi:hypothetical protein
MDDVLTFAIDHADKLGHISSLPAMLAGAGIAWNVSRMMTKVNETLSKLSVRLAHIEGHLGIESRDE